MLKVGNNSVRDIPSFTLKGRKIQRNNNGVGDTSDFS